MLHDTVLYAIFIMLHHNGPMTGSAFAPTFLTAGSTDHFQRGLLLWQGGDVAAATRQFRAAHVAAPGRLDAVCALSVALSNAGQIHEAVAAFRRAWRLARRAPALHLTFSRVYSALGQPERALKANRAAVRLAPRDGQAHAMLAALLLQRRQFAEAASCGRRAVELGEIAAWSNLGAAHQALGQPQAAVEAFRAALAAQPDSPAHLANLGNALTDLCQFDAAVPICEAAVARAPAVPELRINLGRVLDCMGQHDAAIAQFREALRLQPGSHAAHYHLGVALLATGDLAEGWGHYEHRLQIPSPATGKRPLDGLSRFPLWDGSALPGKTLIVLAEQGHGDIIQFSRFLPLLRPLCGRVLFRVPGKLAHLFEGLAELSVDEAPLPRFDAYCPLMSLPSRLKVTMATLPADIPYVGQHPETARPATAQVERWRLALPPAALRIGVAWQGNPGMFNDAGRSVPLRHFTALAALPGVRLISLQRGPGCEQMRQPGLESLVHDLGAGFDAGPEAFADTVAVMASLDLVITSDTAIAHLAGALGRPTWVALRRHAEWRWLTEGEDSPWYPTMRLFRQERDSDWGPVFQRMADAISCRPVLRPGVLLAPMSPGDLLDRIAILEIKAARIRDPRQRANVLTELSLLCQARDRAGLRWEDIDGLRQELGAIHSTLWDTENVFRQCERQNDFGAPFIEAACQVIRHNARRAELKRSINTALGSGIIEEKDYGT